MQAERALRAGETRRSGPGQSRRLNEFRTPALAAGRRASLLAAAGLLWLPVWLGVGLALRLWSFGRFPLREDEALYAYWARLVASGQDVMLERVAVDKPPFFIYSLAHVFSLLGPHEDTGRLLNVFCSFLAMLFLWALARRVYGLGPARLALALYALSPFAISFAPTLYTDPMMVAWVLLALLCASHGFGLGAGLALGMAFATKQNALLFAPLVLLAIPASHQARERPGFAQRLPPVLRLSLPLLLAAAGFAYVWHKVWQWDRWRILPAEIPSFWQQSWNSYGGLTWLPVAAWPARAADWAQVWQWLGGWLPGTLALALLVLLAALPLRRYALPAEPQASASVPARRWDALMLAFSAGYALLHVVASFQPWDRYLLGLAPLLALLAARGAGVGWRLLAGRQRLRLILSAAVALAMLWGAGRAAQARIPVGGDRGAYTGIEVVARYLQETVPAERGVLYQRWLGWHWSWYLWDGPHGRVYWSEPAMLAADLAANPDGYTRMVVFPAWQEPEVAPLAAALAPLDVILAERLRVRLQPGDRSQFVVYQIVPEAGP